MEAQAGETRMQGARPLEDATLGSMFDEFLEAQNRRGQAYEPEFARAWAQHDPERARALLDEMGLVDQDGDGRRDRLDGEPLEITLEYMIGETPKQITLDLVTAHWREVGVQVDLRQISGSQIALQFSGQGACHVIRFKLRTWI